MYVSVCLCVIELNMMVTCNFCAGNGRLGEEYQQDDQDIKIQWRYVISIRCCEH